MKTNVNEEQRNRAPRMPSRYGGYFADIQGRTFGRLTAIHPTEYRDNSGSVIWVCLCECKTITYVPQDRLTSHSTQSCGCLKKKAQETIGSQLHFADGTCVEWIEKRKHRSDNTSGFRGVYKFREGQFRVSIGFKGKRYHIGTFKSFDEAKQARLDAEQALYLPFLQEYYSSIGSDKYGDSKHSRMS